ncbi:MAG: HD domain-containing phosphohydrolase [Candidatus Dormibacteria bacterium]
MPPSRKNPRAALSSGVVAFERALSDADFRLIAESIPHIVWAAAPDGSTDYFNKQGTDYTGRTADANYGWDWLNLVHPGDAERARTAWEDATRTVTPYQMEYRLRRHDGEYRWHTFRGLPLRDPSGRVLRWIGTATDIDDHKRAQRQQAETLSLLETLYATAPIGLGFIDRNMRKLRVNQKLAESSGGSIEAQLGRRVSDVVPGLWPSLEPVLRRVLDDGEPVIDLEMSGETAADPGRPHHWLNSYYPVRVHDEVIGIGVVVVDITDRKEAEQARIEVSQAAVAAMAATVEARDPYTAGHQRRVADIASAIAAEMGISPFEVEGISLAASIHDVGKVRIPAEILARPGRLHPAEFELMKTHSQAGYEIVQGIKFPWPVADMIRQHHERFDGSGYPDHIKGNAIVLGARIIAVADVLEAMSAHRPYRPAVGMDAAIEEISRGRGSLFDPEVVDAFKRAFARADFPVHRKEDFGLALQLPLT